MKELTKIAKKYGTDKGSYHTFTDFYDEHFDSIRDNVSSLLEIGILRGASLRMWHDYFINAQIYGIDIDEWKHGALNFNFKEERINAYNCSCENVDKFKTLFDNKLFDIICDDGSHTMKHQLESIANYFKYVKPGGYYILEDLHTSFIPKYTKDEDITTYDVIYRAQKTKEVIKTKYFNDEQHQYLQENIDQIIIYKKNPTVFTDSITCIIKKR